MRKFLAIFSIAVFSAAILSGQEEEQDYTFTFGGFISTSAFIDTYQSATSREGEIYLYPLRAKYDAEGNDINDAANFEMLAVMSRAYVKVSGPKLFGAKTFAHIEGDFSGTSTDKVRQFRLRHAYMKLNWESGMQLISGHTWHPMFNAECFASTPIWPIGVPFAVLNRSTQMQLNYSVDKLTFTGAILSNSYHLSAGTSESTQANAVLPDLQFRVKYKSDNFFIAANAGYFLLKPRTLTDSMVVTDKTVSGFNTQVAMAYKISPVSIKGAVIYGSNLSRFVMLGGYGRVNDIVDYDYASLKTVSAWLNIHGNGKIQPSLFAGYTKNLGSEAGYVPLAGRGQDIADLWTVSPYLRVKDGKMSYAVECRFTGAVYANAWDNNFVSTDTDDATVNTRINLNIRYAF